MNQHHNEFMKIIAIFLLISISKNVWSFSLPSHLSKTDRQDVTQILGVGSSTKFQTHPYPLGGHSGFELGISAESIDLKDINLLGDKSSNLNTLDYPRITVGKGLYNNFDIYAHFTPFFRQDQIFEYGGLLRWSFYQAEFQPINFSLALHGNTINVSDVFINSTFGADIIAGMTFDRLSIYVGAGQLNANSRFSGKDLSLTVTDTGTLEKESLTMSHSFAGLYYQLETFFLNLEANKYSDPVYSLKLGLKL